MWVESSDGKSLVNLDQVMSVRILPSTRAKWTHTETDDAKTYDIVGYRIVIDDVLLGSYDTEDQARRALKFLKDELFYFAHNKGHVCRIPKKIKEGGAGDEERI